MDVVGSLGYIGQDISFVDSERFAYITGNALCIYDTTKGPRDMHWKMDSGLSCFATCLETQCLAITPASANNNDVLLVSSSDQNVKATLSNPTQAPLIFMCFSREGDKLYGISDTTDHQLLVWSISGNISRLLLSKKLPQKSIRCAVNPCNANHICMFGDDGTIVGIMSEVLGVYTVKFDSIDLDVGITSPAGEPVAVSTLKFVLWTPQNRILIADKAGSIFEYRVDTSRARYLGQISVPDKKGVSVAIRPTCVALSVHNLIVGTEGGVVYWYPVLNLMLAIDEEAMIDIQTPVQMCAVNSIACSLAMDQNFQTLLVGTAAGDIFKVAVDAVESEFGKTDQDQDLLNTPYGGADTAKPQKPIESVQPVRLGSDAHNGGVMLCSRHITIDVQKYSARSRSSLSMFVTGSHKGSLLFWRYSSQVVDNMVPGGGIRRSAPRALRSVFQLLLSGDGPSSGSAICAIELVALPMKHAKLLLVGLEDGTVEVWTLEAQENEDEDARDSAAEEKSGYSLRLIEDDEGSCLVRLEARKIFQIKLFQCPVSMFLAFPVTIQDKDQSLLKLAVASELDHRVYFINALKEEQIAIQKGVDSFLAVDQSQVLRSMTWVDDHLYLFCENGDILLYQTRDFETPQLKRRIECGLRGVVEGSLTANTASVVVLSNSPQMHICSLKSVNDEHVEFRAFDHSDIVIAGTHAPNGRYFATGCVDGSVFVWKIDVETEEISQVNRLKPHADAVSSIVFSSDSSLLMTTGIDGSCFLLTLDKPTTKGPNRNGSIKASFMQEEGPQYLSELLPEKPLIPEKEPASRSEQQQQLTWMEQKELEKAKDLKSRHKFKAMGISAAINEIGQRLRVLVAQNDERTELERLERSDFVIDVKRQEALVVGNDATVGLMRRLYKQKNLCDELRAARIRSKCWDQMEVKAVALLPLLPTADAALKLGVTSFPVQKYSVAQQNTLSKVKRLRGMEVRAQRADEHGSVSRISGTPYYRCAWFTALAGCPQSVSWISNDGTRWPISDKVASLLAVDRVVEGAAVAGKDSKAGPDAGAVEAEDDDGTVDSREDMDIDLNNVLNLLYPPQAVRSQVQKRTQIVLLKEVIRQIKVKFNDQFEKLRREKGDIIGSIDSRNIRMRAILEDLHQTEDLFAPVMANKEVAGSSITVESSELRTRPYESEANKQARLREEEEKRLRDLANDKEDVKGRALDEMMHGTLEVKRDVFAEASAFTKPEWMDTLSTSEMNEAQLKEYDAYVTKLKALQEEQANYRKSLEQEMKRLKNEVSELCKAYDEKVNDLVCLKVLVHREVFSHEIYMARLACNMAKTEQTWKFLRKSEEQVQCLRTDRADLRRSIEHLSSQLEDMKGKINSIQEEERQMDKTFRRDLQNLCNNTFDQDALKVLTQLYRQRSYPRGGYEASAENYGDQSEADASASASKNNRRSKDGSARGGKNSKSQSKRGGGGGGGMNTSSTNDVNKTKRLKASKGGASAGGGAGGKDSNLGPMQQAAQALRSSEETSYKDKDPYYEALLELEKQKVMQEAQIPILSSQSIELDCPEGFDIDQFSWSKLQELRTARIEKEIEGKMLSIEFSKLKQKLEHLDTEESVLATCISDIKSSRDVAVNALKDLDANLDIIVRLRQGQDEVDKDAVVTDYSDALLLPIAVLSKYNVRIKELGREKISVLSKIKLFRRKINLIDWEAKHHGLEARHYEAYLTDLQLFRVTRELQKVIREGSDATQTKVSNYLCYTCVSILTVPSSCLYFAGEVGESRSAHRVPGTGRRGQAAHPQEEQRGGQAAAGGAKPRVRCS